MVTKLDSNRVKTQLNLYGDKTQTQIVTKTHIVTKLKMLRNKIKKTKMVTKLTNSKCERKTQILTRQTQIVTKFQL